MEYVQKASVMDEKAMERALTRISFEIIERNSGSEDLCILGIQRRGAVLAERISKRLSEIENREIPTGSLDVTHYRDDNAGKQLPSQNKSVLPCDISNKNVILVDDVLYTGRTVRAAIDAVMAKGRPKRIQLAVLIDRGHRELPIRPDFIGKNVPTSKEEKISVHVTEFDGENKVSIITKGVR
ncbi:MAG: bifunctional pyr operon transcriptional regulator/uracil phosphoribosyltransferase PyrR [Clostridia bacterium]|nr:bifunctional pyr operon transcriptional regulator/uracil phosphoribosyltransferase PyrR [Clostridia bacterium]